MTDNLTRQTRVPLVTERMRVAQATLVELEWLGADEGAITSAKAELERLLALDRRGETYDPDF